MEKDTLTLYKALLFLSNFIQIRNWNAHFYLKWQKGAKSLYNIELIHLFLVQIVQLKSNKNYHFTLNPIQMGDKRRRGRDGVQVKKDGTAKFPETEN